MKAKGKIVEFVGRVVRQTYSSENYKMYAVDVDREKYPDIKFTIYGNAVIGGNLHSLTPESEYYIKAEEKNGKKGYKYEVLNIRKTDLRNEEDVYAFLQEILTFKQASTLYAKYPNIVDLVVSGRSNEVDLSQLYGIKEYTFGKIKEKIMENYGLFDLIAEFKGVLTISMLKKLYNKYASIEKIRSELRFRPYKTLVGLSRVGFKTADRLLLEMEKEGIIEFAFDLKTSKERCMACILYFLEENETNGNTKMSIPDLRKYVMTLTPACSHHFVDCLNEGKEHNNIYYNKNTIDVALMRTYLTELAIAAIVLDAIKNKKQRWSIDWESYRDKGEYVLSDEQLKALELICNNQIAILCGFAGSGKTATTNTLIQMLINNNKTFMLLSPTGRAAKVLSSYTNMPASTIHRGYGYTPGVGWGYNSKDKVPYDIVIVDESSMCDISLFWHLLDGIDFSETKLFIIGDAAQLCSVGPGNILNDLINSKRVPSVFLTKIFRYQEGGLMHAATDTRNCKIYLNQVSDKPVILGKNKDYVFWNCDKDKMIDHLTKLYSQLLEQGYNSSDIAIITAQNKGAYGTVVINNIIQKIANKNYGSKNCLQIGDTKFYEGDLVMQTVNNYESLLYFDGEDIDPFDEDKFTLIANGETGVIKRINDYSVIIDFDGTLIKYTNGEMSDIVLSYSYTSHKSQGGSARIVIFLCCSSHTFMLNSNLLYVGLTRTRERCFHLGDLTTINRAIKKKENLQRKTFLEDLLKTSQ